jgi:3',5'-cyclic AMP phosphodiesterase CpdA
MRLMSSSTVLFHASDLHFGYEDREALAWFMAEVERERPAAVLCTGDLTMRGSAREYVLAKDWLGALPVPLVLVAGNHDVPYYHHMIRRLTRPYQRFHALEAAVAVRLDLPGIAVVPLKTVARAQLRVNWSKGRVSNRDLDLAVHDLGVEADKTLKLVVCHHPLVDAGTQGSGSTRGGRRALAALARAGADAVLSGHVHDCFDLTTEAEGLPVRLIGAGTLSQRLRVTRPSYNRLEWNAAEGLRVSHHSFA